MNDPDDRARRATDHREPYAPDDSTGPRAIVRHDRDLPEGPRGCGRAILLCALAAVLVYGGAWALWRAM